jgi:tRNA 2-thiouridine synthesizing protein A
MRVRQGMAMDLGVTHLDLCGLKCPMPALLLRRALKAATPGDVIMAEATDPLAHIDLVFAAQQSGAEVLSIETGSAHVRVTIRAGQT